MPPRFFGEHVEPENVVVERLGSFKIVGVDTGFDKVLDWGHGSPLATGHSILQHKLEKRRTGKRVVSIGLNLRKAKRTTDAVARFGGEEFVIMCEQTDRDGAMLLAERIREELQRTAFQTPKGELSVTCSLGVATFPDAGSDWETLFKAADEALYVSKRSGRNRSTPWSPRRKKTKAAS